MSAATLDTAPRPATSGPRRRRRSRWDRSAIAFVAPTMIFAIVFLLVPMVLAFAYSFAEIAPLSGKVTWVGFANYVTMLTDPTFYRALLNTVLFIVLVVPLSLVIGLALAVLLNSVMPARKLFRTIIYLPLVISGVATGLIGTFLYNETIGVINKALLALHLPTVPWQSEGGPAFASVVLVTLWIRVGFTMIIYLAGLQAVPVELQEAASVEGANAWQRFRYITLPLLGPSTFFLLIMSVIYAFQVFDTVFVLTGGGPGSATEVLGTYAYKTAFGPARDQGYGAAIGVVIFFFTLVFTVLQWRTNRTRDEVA
ncbi:ABC-type sugar transport system permease subunit [Friedmanniella endophytica]|uniref:ABC-type sugar transport system permease subunit n=1 Tax=Microlunatus kandeliicorticis TaxID=1759536 RepID=A0A7W3IS25_9ACTN|nr:sugar ABC transporter permease [Microlunatus kandeliicorticis]MBA8794212.1 ABC-type sugar transport system permease subunit [Microlunatus kandeliicorticis]